MDIIIIIYLLNFFNSLLFLVTITVTLTLTKLVDSHIQFSNIHFHLKHVVLLKAFTNEKHVDEHPQNYEIYH